MLALALQNLLSPMVLFFVLGVAAALARSDLSVPDQVAKLLALYLLMSIGFRGGVEVAHQGVDATMLATIAAGIALSFATPFLAYLILRTTSRLDPVNAAAVAAHYGSISAVTFVAVTGMLGQLGIAWDGWMVAVAAAMETPAIVAALLIARGRTDGAGAEAGESRAALLREVAFNGSIVILIGAFAIGAATGERGATLLKPFLVDAFPGVLCLFLLDMGLVAGRGLAQGRRHLSVPVGAFAIVMPLIGGTVAGALAHAIGLSLGSTAVLITLAASASYIAVPAAMRLALPQANPAVALTLSLGITFPFNLLVGIPLYIALAGRIAA
ncbi:sodium-dependent bicarbonate transport family permease [Rhodoplanes elegans]|uniref:Sodium-dependent bicarbonate transport family permease n=1 Tax=Rhodoplanes elegans TaxID=29408 RepID=A0A327KIU9_9BRAD|nr:sodium-dependent bicarbonate transport family permease [Rhodoplanes elegans]MBK5957921.1 sodium-dependent bicarbonate transport family permease [Rhodoplanes elegans]RAI37563.1 sodium-dependent bicarbonate transport family permease [Rhodoplanes elegans]